MRNLVIKNVGPIKDVNLELKRFNVLIGPQSSGKSTIVKILSTCSWIEKETATTQNVHAIPDGKSFKALVETFHKMSGYFNGDSEVLYETDYVRMHYLKGKYEIELKEGTVYKRKKVCYIPAERNMVTLPELQGFEFKATNLRSFLFDWFAAREFFGPKNKTDILDLGVKYFFDGKEPFEKDRVEHSNGETYGISLPNASSGLQSVVPLVVMLLYYSGHYYNDYGAKLSFADTERKHHLQVALMDKYVTSRIPKDSNGNEDSNMQNFLREAYEGNEEYSRWLKEFERSYKSLTVPQSTDFIIEEPEQNLFPATQKALVEELVRTCNGSEHEHGFTLTTHSPYVLAALNNLIYAYQVGLKSGDAVNKVVSNRFWINPSSVCALMLKDGAVEDIMDADLMHIMAEKIDSVSAEINEMFDSLMNIDVNGA